MFVGLINQFGYLFKQTALSCFNIIHLWGYINTYYNEFAKT